MKKKPLKSLSQGGNTPLSDFASIAATKLKFLETEFGLSRSSDVTRPPEAVVKYESDSVCITAFYEYPKSVWIVVEIRKNHRYWKSVGLHQVLKRIGYEVPNDVLRTLNVEHTLSYYGTALKENWTELIGNIRNTTRTKSAGASQSRRSERFYQAPD
jgi:hypothetical protein